MLSGKFSTSMLFLFLPAGFFLSTFTGSVAFLLGDLAVFGNPQVS